MGEPTYIVSPRKAAYNEQQKLTATFLNNIAAACVIAGVVTPVLSLAGIIDKPLTLLVWAAVAGGFFGYLIHLVARGFLSHLKD